MIDNPFAAPPAAPPAASPPPPAAPPPAILAGPPAPPPASAANPFAASPPPPPPVAQAPAPVQPAAPPAAPAPAAPVTSTPPPMPGHGASAPAMPGMRTPGAATAGAGRGVLKLSATPDLVVMGTYRLRVKRYIEPKSGGDPSIVLEVWDENEKQKMLKGDKTSVQGAEVMIKLWADGRRQQFFRDFGYPESTWPNNQTELPIAQMLADKPSAVCEVDWREGSTPGRGFNSLKSIRDPQRSA